MLKFSTTKNEKIRMLKDGFKDLVNQCLVSRNLIGSGNPNSQILFVGKEGSNQQDGREKNINDNLDSWKNQMLRDEPPIFSYSIKQFRTGHTWRKYQKLHDYIFENTDKQGVVFENNIFTTEINETPFKRTGDAQKGVNFTEDVIDRKSTFFKFEFIQNFNVVVLACSNYIQNIGIGGEWEINSIFGVKWEKEYNTEHNGKKYRFDTHYNENKTKLVIHCRQLSGSTPEKYLQDMGTIIREFIQFSKI
jgi:hypothetical protein